VVLAAGGDDGRVRIAGDRALFAHWLEFSGF
jgi:hypothetical protein